MAYRAHPAAARAAFAALLFLPSLGRGAGPESAALTDRAHWPTPFDLASRAEILAYAEAFASTEKLGLPAIERLVGLPHVDLPSIERWRGRSRAILLRNLHEASWACMVQREARPFCSAGQLRADAVASWPDLVRFAAAVFARPEDPANPSAPWLRDARRFNAAYVREQMRLAAVFGQVASEVLPVSPSEVLGDELKDGSFLLTFDDGPSPRGGATDGLAALLRAKKMNGLFFVLGQSLKARLRDSPEGDLRAVYDGMCIGSHGMEHRPHAKWLEEAEPIDRLSRELGSLLPAGQKELSLFRPPYGQRSAELVRGLEQKGMRVMLWNIDSQDWRKEVTAELAAGRVMTLMLLWRRGIILFHDVHAKPEKALPLLWRMLEGSGVRWIDCRQAAAALSHHE